MLMCSSAARILSAGFAHYPTKKKALVMAVSASFFDSECMFQTLKVRTACGNEHSRGDGLSGNVSLLSGNEHRFINITMHLDILYV